MDLKPGYFYHIYNRGNNSQRIFYIRDNYLFFLNKMKEHLLPYVSIVAWSLMPNHFHWIVFVHKNKIMKEPKYFSSKSSGDQFKVESQTINQSIGVLLASYTRALQKQEKFTGSLFQKRTKEKALVDDIKIEPAYWNTAFGTQINFSKGKSYLEACIEYVHQNPVFSGLVQQAEDWEYSSLRDFVGLRDGKLIDYELLSKESLIIQSRHPNYSRETRNTCIIGIGSNIEVEFNIPKMLDLLQAKVEVLQVSRFRKTKPIGIVDQPDFTNGAVKIKTKLDQSKLNSLLKGIEDEMGRDRSNPKFGPRCIDLDIAVWNGKIVDKDYYSRDFLRESVDELLV